VTDHVNLLKLCVGTDSVEELVAWQASHRAAWAGGRPVHVTRMWPKRAEEVLNGGSLYWVFKGVVLARQRILGLEERLGGDGISGCALVLDPDVIRTEAAPRRPFQGWRYLSPEEAPRDLPKGRAREEALPPKLAQALAEIGLR
jgi:hypothetical protein